MPLLRQWCKRFEAAVQRRWTGIVCDRPGFSGIDDRLFHACRVGFGSDLFIRWIAAVRAEDANGAKQS